VAFDAQCVIVGQLLFEEIITAQNYLSLLTQFIALLEENELGLLVSARQGDLAFSENKNSVLAGLLWRSYCYAWALATTPSDFFL
jgi:hypothetical protein